MHHDLEPRNEPAGAPRAPVRTCVGCGARDGAPGLLRIFAAGGEVAFDLSGGGLGRGAHVHPRPECIERAPRGLSRVLRRPVAADARALGELLVQACERRIAGLLLSARRLRAVAVGADAAIDALAKGAPLAVVAADAGSIARDPRIARCVAEGRAIAWSTKADLGALLGGGAVAVCAVAHRGIAAELKRTRAAADAGVAAGTRPDATREGAGCSRFPEAR